MNFSFKLLNLKCNSVLSSNDSPWGTEDGIRATLVAWMGNQQTETLVSGREFPPPDLVDNYAFSPGKSLNLASYPPSNKGTWETGAFDVGETDNVWLGIIGVNEGLPWVGGGGGGAVGGLFLFLIEEFIKNLVGGLWSDPSKDNGTAAQAPTSAAVATGFEALNRGLDKLNNPEDCRGVAFAYETVFSSHYLFSTHLTNRFTTLQFDKNALNKPLAILNRAYRSGSCGEPDYEATLQVRRLDDPTVHERVEVRHASQGVPRSLTPAFAHCVPEGKELLVWPVMRDLTITFEPTISWPTMIWRIEDVEIHQPSGTLTFNKMAELPPDTGRTPRDVTVGFEVSEIGGLNRLALETKGTDGNYTLSVALLLKFFDAQPPVMFWQDELDVRGQLLDGNDAYQEYLDCVRRLMASFRDIARRYVEVNRHLGPGVPVERVLAFEDDMRALTSLLERTYLMRRET